MNQRRTIAEQVAVTPAARACSSHRREITMKAIPQRDE